MTNNVGNMGNTGAKADIFFGATKTTKTSQIGMAALYFFKKTGKPTLLYSADNGGWEPIQSLVDEGIIHAYNIRSLPYAPEAIDKLTQGWTYNPDTERWLPPDPKFWAKYSILAIEGLASIGEWAMDYFAATGQKLGMAQSFTKVKIGSTEYSGLGQDHYGYTQGHLLHCVVNSARLIPVERVIWTSLEMRGKDFDQNPVYGPALVGNKKVDKVGQYFGNVIHLDLIESTETDQKTKQPILRVKPVMFLRPHLDPATKNPFYCGTRAPFQFASEVPDYIDPPDAGKLYGLLDSLKEKAKKQLASLKEGVAQ